LPNFHALEEFVNNALMERSAKKKQLPMLTLRSLPDAVMQGLIEALVTSVGGDR
jgi:hypothetical protein